MLIRQLRERGKLTNIVIRPFGNTVSWVKFFPNELKEIVTKQYPKKITEEGRKHINHLQNLRREKFRRNNTYG